MEYPPAVAMRCFSLPLHRPMLSSAVPSFGSWACKWAGNLHIAAQKAHGMLERLPPGRRELSCAVISHVTATLARSG